MHGLENIELRRFMEGSIYAPCPESRQCLMETMLAVVLNLPVQRKCFGRVLLASWCAGDLLVVSVSWFSSSSPRRFLEMSWMPWWWSLAWGLLVVFLVFLRRFFEGARAYSRSHLVRLVHPISIAEKIVSKETERQIVYV